MIEYILPLFIANSLFTLYLVVSVHKAHKKIAVFDDIMKETARYITLVSDKIIAHNHILCKHFPEDFNNDNK